MNILCKWSFKLNHNIIKIMKDCNVLLQKIISFPDLKILQILPKV